MPRNSRKAQGSSVPANSIETGDSADAIMYCSGLSSSVATILDATFSRLCLCPASMDLLVVIFKYGMVAPFRWDSVSNNTLQGSGHEHHVLLEVDAHFL